jgi:glycosyltransferase involved in cell wall biosynthesis
LLRHWRDGLWVYHDPYYAPHAGRRLGGPVTSLIRERAFERALHEIGVSHPILWLLRPQHADQIGRWGESLVVYHVTDDYASFPLVSDPAAFRRGEDALLERADLVIVTSPALWEARSPRNPHTVLVPNAVDYEGFRAAVARGDRPAQLGEGSGAIPRPRIGYCGALNEKLDYELLAHVARARPTWQLALAGGLDLSAHPDKHRVLLGLPNVYWLGRLPVDEVPGAIAAMDVCLLPYECNAWTAHIDSLKLYEYLACGRPVVTTDVPAARRFEALVRIAGDPDAFVAEIETALAGDAPEAQAARLAEAAQNTWDQRVAQIEGLLVEALARRAASRAQVTV